MTHRDISPTRSSGTGSPFGRVRSSFQRPRWSARARRSERPRARGPFPSFHPSFRGRQRERPEKLDEIGLRPRRESGPEERATGRRGRRRGDLRADRTLPEKGGRPLDDGRPFGRRERGEEKERLGRRGAAEEGGAGDVVRGREDPSVRRVPHQREGATENREGEKVDGDVLAPRQLHERSLPGREENVSRVAYSPEASRRSPSRGERASARDPPRTGARDRRPKAPEGFAAGGSRARRASRDRAGRPAVPAGRRGPSPDDRGGRAGRRSAPPGFRARRASRSSRSARGTDLPEAARASGGPRGIASARAAGETFAKEALQPSNGPASGAACSTRIIQPP